MSDPASFFDLDGQQVELLAARTVLSMFSVQDTGGGLAPDQIARGALAVLGMASTSPGADGGSDGGGNGADNG